MSPPKLKLTYFDFTGRAEAIRLALVVGAIPFEDERLPGSAWMSLKNTPQFPFKTMPVLQVGEDRVLSQSTSILRYVGKLANLYPEDPLEAHLVDEVMETAEDLMNLFSPTFAIQDLAEKIAMRKSIVENKAKPLLSCLDARLAGLRTGDFVVGNQVTIADLRLSSMEAMIASGFLDGVDTNLLADFKNITDIILKTNQVPAVAAWNRKQNLPKLRLLYFDLPGRAEPIRLALHAAGIQFEDERVNFPAWIKMKSESPFGQLPVLHVGSQSMAQSSGLLRYVGRLSETYPEDPLLALKVDEIVSGVNDVTQAIYNTFPMEGSAQAAAREELKKAKLPGMLKALDARIALYSGSAGFSVGNSLTIADTALLGLMELTSAEKFKEGMPAAFFLPASFFEPYENIKRASAKAAENAGIAEYLSNKK